MDCFADKEFDFVYCSHVLEHVRHPENACRELMRIGKRGYIETPTRGKDLWLSTAKVSHHVWSVEYLHSKLIFTEYLAEEFHDEAEWEARTHLLNSDYDLWDLDGRRLDPKKDIRRLYHCLAIPSERSRD